MLGAADKKFCKMLVGAFNEAIEEEHGPHKDAENTKPMIEHGAELLGCVNKPAVKTMWYGFYLGFMQGCRFMAEAADDPEGVKAYFGE